MLACPIATNKADGFDGRMVTDGVDGGYCAVNNVEHTRGEA